MLTDIYMKILEDSLIGFQVVELTQFRDRVQGKQLEKYKCKLWFLCSASHLMLIDIYMKFCKDLLNGFQV